MNYYQEGWRDAYRKGKMNPKYWNNKDYQRGYTAGIQSFELSFK